MLIRAGESIAALKIQLCIQTDQQFNKDFTWNEFHYLDESWKSEHVTVWRRTSIKIIITIKALCLVVLCFHYISQCKHMTSPRNNPKVGQLLATEPFMITNDLIFKHEIYMRKKIVR